MLCCKALFTGTQKESLNVAAPEWPDVLTVKTLRRTSWSGRGETVRGHSETAVLHLSGHFSATFADNHPDMLLL